MSRTCRGTGIDGGGPGSALAVCSHSEAQTPSTWPAPCPSATGTSSSSTGPEPAPLRPPARVPPGRRYPAGGRGYQKGTERTARPAERSRRCPMWRAWRPEKLRRRVAQVRDECDRISRDGKYGFATTRLGVTDMELMGEAPGYSYLGQAIPAWQAGSPHGLIRLPKPQIPASVRVLGRVRQRRPRGKPRTDNRPPHPWPGSEVTQCTESSPSPAPPARSAREASFRVMRPAC